MPNVNSWTGVGHLSRDIEVKQVKDYNVVEVPICVNSGYGDKKVPVFTKVEVWGNPSKPFDPTSFLADGKKGDLIQCHNVEYCTSKYQDKEGKDVYKHYFKATPGSRVFVVKQGRRDAQQDQASQPAGAPQGSPVTNDDLPF